MKSIPSRSRAWTNLNFDRIDGGGDLHAYGNVLQQSMKQKGNKKKPHARGGGRRVGTVLCAVLLLGLYSDTPFYRTDSSCPL